VAWLSRQDREEGPSQQASYSCAVNNEGTTACGWDGSIIRPRYPPVNSIHGQLLSPRLTSATIHFDFLPGTPILQTKRQGLSPALSRVLVPQPSAWRAVVGLRRSINQNARFPDSQTKTFFPTIKQSSGRRVPYSGMFPCFFRGVVSVLCCSISSARMICQRVSRGSITSSMYPRSAAM